jgi:hypothetical protein
MPRVEQLVRHAVLGSLQQEYKRKKLITGVNRRKYFILQKKNTFYSWIDQALDI